MPLPVTTTAHPPLLWDVFCRVIDNFGDLGVCWRLCADLAERGHRVRLWVDETTPLHWMAPGALQGTWPGVQVLRWEQSQDADVLAALPPADVWIEGFGCEIATNFIAQHATNTRATGQLPITPPVWINLEYLSAESFVERSHGLPSPVMQGPAKGWTKYFFYPGFSKPTGGLLREPDLLPHIQAFGLGGQRKEWLAQHGIDWAGERLVSLFCYEPATLEGLLAQLDVGPESTLLLVTAGRAHQAVEAIAAQRLSACSPDSTPAFQHLRIAYLPQLSQSDFDTLLWACDLNFVRGEDSVVRAIWAGNPLVWHIYPQQDAAHIPKLDAFLEMLGADPSLRAFHHAWNGVQSEPGATALPAMDLPSWSQTVQSARTRLLQMDDLVSQLVGFVLKKR
ncbi:MAG: elongation factor P maturation arginine rhamnosyltransferase EarP [Pseudomonadota bacterium]